MAVRASILKQWNKRWSEWGTRFARALAGSDSRYPGVSIVIHWVTAAALALVVALGWRMTVTGGTEREQVLALHISIGVLIFVLTVVRIVWWPLRRALPPASEVRWERWAARAVHATLHLFLIAIPVLGWLNLSSSSAGAANRLFGWIALPSFTGVAGNSAVGSLAEVSHRWLAYTLCALVFFHVTGAIKHHLKEPGRGLVRMLPGARRILGWRTVGLAGVLAVLFVMGGGFADPVLPSFARLVPAPSMDGPAVSIDPRRTTVFAGVVQPIFEQKCVSCHGDRAQKGGLRLDHFAALMKGGEGGRAVLAKNADESELIRRVMLPASSKDAMPPSGRTPLTAAEGQLLVWWVESGADDVSTLAAKNPPPLVQNILGNLGVTSESPVFAQAVAPASPEVLKKLQAAGYQVQLLFAGNGFLRAQARFDRDTTQPLRIDPLVEIAEQLTWLDLSGATIAPEQFAALARLHKLQRLNLAGTAADDRTIERLRELPHLEILNLYGTAITDQGLRSVAHVPSLTSVYVSQTAVTPQGIGQLCQEQKSMNVVWQPNDAQATAGAEPVCSR